MCIIREEIGRGYSRHMVNGVGVTSADFGNVELQYDDESKRMLRMFVPKPATEEVMRIYNINEDEYQEVCMDLTMYFNDWRRLKG